MRRILQKLRVEHSTVPLSLIADYENLALPYIDRPEDFTPAIHAFCSHLRLHIGNYKRHFQTVTNRMDLMRITRSKYKSIVVNLHIRQALRTSALDKTALDTISGAEVLVYREKDIWQAPFAFF